MKKRSLAALGLVLSMIPAVSAAGAVTRTISSEAELRAFAQEVNAGHSFEGEVVVLAQDIVLNTRVVDTQGNLNPGNYSQWTCIGTQENPFRGSFDGQGHTITGLYLINEEADCQGLFGTVSNATIANVTVKDGYLAGREDTGAVVGFADNNSVVVSCHNDKTSVHGKNRAGGSVGWTNNSHVYNCSSDGIIYSDRCAGGVVGDVYRNSKIYNCFSSAIVDGKELVGGITGGATGADIQNCLFVGQVLFSQGYLLSGDDNTRAISNSYALQSESINAGIPLGRGAGGQTFAEPAAVLANPVTVNDVPCTTVLQALNAWVGVQDTDLDYSPWVQTSLYPYLRDGVTSAIQTSYGSEVSTWSSPEMEEAYKENLIPDVLIGEDLTKSINRAEFAAVCVKVYENLAATQALPSVINPFTDCSDVEVLKAYNIGVVNGITPTTFVPYQLLNREQAATMLTRVFKRVTMPGWTLPTDGQFALKYEMPAIFRDDSEISGYAKDSVYFMVANGIINGMGDGTFHPRNITDRQTAEAYANATREQALAIALRMVKELG